MEATIKKQQTFIASIMTKSLKEYKREEDCSAVRKEMAALENKLINFYTDNETMRRPAQKITSY